MRKKYWFLILIIFFLTLGLFFLFLKPANHHQNNNLNNNLTPMTNELANKKILMVVAFKNFRDEEYFIPNETFEKNGYQVITSSDQKGEAVGSAGGTTEVDLLVQEVNPIDYAAVVFCGGPGMVNNLDNKNFQNLALEFQKQDKLVSAICIAPALLAKAGLLVNKKATVWSSSLDKSAIKILKDNGAIYEDKSVVIDGKIITANGPEAAKEFGEKIMEVLQK